MNGDSKCSLTNYLAEELRFNDQLLEERPLPRFDAPVDSSGFGLFLLRGLAWEKEADGISAALIKFWEYQVLVTHHFSLILSLFILFYFFPEFFK